MFPRQLEYLVALDRERHFGRAAAACHVSQPALSEAIRSLERELGVPLVVRGRRFEGLTPEGERVLTWAQRAVDNLRGLEQEVSRLRDGLDRHAPPAAPSRPSLPTSSLVTTRFREHHPRMRVTLHSMTSREIAHGLTHGELDAGLTYLDNEPLADVDMRPLWRERYLLLAPADGALGERTTIGWAEAATLPLCLLTPDMQHRRIVDSAFAAAGAVPEPVVETNSVSAVLAHARSGIPGVTAQTWVVTQALPAGPPGDPAGRPGSDPDHRHRHLGAHASACRSWTSCSRCSRRWSWTRSSTPAASRRAAASCSPGRRSRETRRTKRLGWRIRCYGEWAVAPTHGAHCHRPQLHGRRSRLGRSLLEVKMAKRSCPRRGDAAAVA